jgi:tRNA U54 and U55 pseudouridine synthase Pus10
MPRTLFLDFRVFLDSFIKKLELTRAMEVSCSYESILVYGRYIKLSRKVSQTPWFVSEGPNTDLAVTSV